DDNEAFMEGEFLDELVNVNPDDNPGPSHHLVETPDETNKDAVEYAKKGDDDEDDYEEEEIQGTIIQGEDGQFYVMMDEEDAEALEVDDNPDTVTFEEDQLVFQSNPIDPNAGVKRHRAALAILQDTEEGGAVEYIQILDDVNGFDGGPQIDLAVGAIQTAEANDDHILHHGMVMEPLPQGMKMRRQRVYGSCRCPECGQSFVNTARLERHLAVHQVFGSFLCPLCGKTYKYEYNLFYHWRRTCRDLNELMSQDDRRTMDVNALRALVEEVASKKAEFGPIEIGISQSVLFQTGPLARLEMPSNPLAGKRGATCRACGVIVHTHHLPTHLDLHKGVANISPDARSVVGGYYCDLCGLMFRQHFNLIKHWRSACAEIQANLPEDIDLTLDDGQLKDMVRELLKRASTNDAVLSDAAQIAAQRERERLKTVEGRGRRDGGENADGAPYNEDMADDDMRRDREQDEADGDDRRGFDERDITVTSTRNTDFADDQGAVFADDFEDDELLTMGEEAAIGTGGAIANRTKWNMAGGPIQCSECFRSFANQGRLERHMAGFHASHGSHHCALCGNRFKYDYNLLYHYRKSCPYTKTFIDKDVRDQMDAVNLRKLIRSLAAKELRLQPQTRPVQRLPKPATVQSNDAIARRDMMRPILENAPHVLTQPRRGMNGKQCPVCSIMFYQDSAIERHMSMRHGMQYSADEEYDRDDDQHRFEEEEATSARGTKLVNKKGDEEVYDEDEAPPTLEMQQPGGEMVMQKEASSRGRFLSTSLSDHHQHLDGALDPHDVEEMYERGEIRNGDTIYIQEDGRRVEYTVNDETAEMYEGEERDDEADEAEAYADEERLRREQQQQMWMIQRPSQLQRRFPAGGEQQMRQQQVAASRPSTSAAAAAAGRKRVRETSIWDDDDLLEEDEEVVRMQREVDRRRMEDAARSGSVTSRGRLVPRRGD
ncbi:hypothetical protein PENTCL1PPCAC_27123, partial [Pristionchus entomophagus]